MINSLFNIKPDCLETSLNCVSLYVKWPSLHAVKLCRGERRDSVSVTAVKVSSVMPGCCGCSARVWRSVPDMKRFTAML